MEQELTQSVEQTQQEDNTFDGLMDSAAERASGDYRQDHDDQGEETIVEDREPEQTPEPEQPQSYEAPQHWSEVDRQQFRKLPPSQQEFLLNRHSAMEADYTKKAQQVAEYRQQIAQFLQQQEAQRQQAQQPKQQERPEFSDPVEELKWEAKEAAKAELQKEFQSRDQRLNAVQHQMYIEGVKQHFKTDPMYPQVQQLIQEHVKNLPPSVGQDLYRRLDADPRAYAEMYQTVRGRLSQLAQQQPQRQQSQPTAVRRETKAPILESGGGDPGSHVSKAKTKQNDIIKRVRTGKASSGDLGSYLESLGAIDRLVS